MSENKLKRSLAPMDVVALGINGVVGSGIFLLPGTAFEAMGPAAILTLLFAGVLSFLIALCFAEVGTKFHGTGGAYLYALRTFGDAPGFFVGWMVFMVTVLSWAAMVNGLADVTSTYVPALTGGAPRVIAMLSFMAVLTAVNLRGAKMGARVSNLFTIGKLVPLVVFVLVGLFFIDTDSATPFAPHGYDGFFDATLVILYAYVGFEALVVPAGEMADPQKAVPLALMAVLGVSVVVYMGVMVVAIGTLPELAGHSNPVLAASENFLGSFGSKIIGAGIIISIVGVNSAQVLVGARRAFALAENGHLPRALSKINSKGAPHVALISLFVVSGGIAVSGLNFADLAKISVVARFAQYIATCWGAIVLRRRETPAERAEYESGRGGVRLPWGPVIPALALALCGTLLFKSAETDLLPFKMGGLALLAGAVVYGFILWNRPRPSPSGAPLD